MDHPQRQKAEVYALHHMPAWLFEKRGGLVLETTFLKLPTLYQTVLGACMNSPGPIIMFSELMQCAQHWAKHSAGTSNLTISIAL